jgi:hypothetical protein
MSFKYTIFDDHGIVFYDEADLKSLGNLIGRVKERKRDINWKRPSFRTRSVALVSCRSGRL